MHVKVSQSPWKERFNSDLFAQDQCRTGLAQACEKKRVVLFGVICRRSY